MYGVRGTALLIDPERWTGAVAPLSTREVFDDHRGLIDALRAGNADTTSAAITEHVNRVRVALTEFQAAQTSKGQKIPSIHVAA
jgi:DNA-binding FadR family transcriptional regulator